MRCINSLPHSETFIACLLLMDGQEPDISSWAVADGHATTVPASAPRGPVSNLGSDLCRTSKSRAISHLPSRRVCPAQVGERCPAGIRAAYWHHCTAAITCLALQTPPDSGCQHPFPPPVFKLLAETFSATMCPPLCSLPSGLCCACLGMCACLRVCVYCLRARGNRLCEGPSPLHPLPSPGATQHRCPCLAGSVYG